MKTKAIICRAHIRCVTEVMESWKKNHKEAMEVRDLEDLIRLCLALGDEVGRLAKEGLGSRSAGKLSDVQAGFIIQAILDHSDKALSAVVERVRNFRDLGYVVGNEGELIEAQRKVRQIQIEFLHQWPFFSSEEIQEACEKIAQGNFYTEEDFSRDLQGEGCTQG